MAFCFRGCVYVCVSYQKHIFLLIFVEEVVEVTGSGEKATLMHVREIKLGDHEIVLTTGKRFFSRKTMFNKTAFCN